MKFFHYLSIREKQIYELQKRYSACATQGEAGSHKDMQVAILGAGAKCQMRTSYASACEGSLYANLRNYAN